MLAPAHLTPLLHAGLNTNDRRGLLRSRADARVAVPGVRPRRARVRRGLPTGDPAAPVPASAAPCVAEALLLLLPSPSPSPSLSLLLPPASSLSLLPCDKATARVGCGEGDLGRLMLAGDPAAATRRRRSIARSMDVAPPPSPLDACCCTAPAPAPASAPAPEPAPVPAAAGTPLPAADGGSAKSARAADAAADACCTALPGVPVDRLPTDPGSVPVHAVDSPAAKSADAPCSHSLDTSCTCRYGLLLMVVQSVARTPKTSDGTAPESVRRASQPNTHPGTHGDVHLFSSATRSWYAISFSMEKMMRARSKCHCLSAAALMRLYVSPIICVRHATRHGVNAKRTQRPRVVNSANTPQ